MRLIVDAAFSLAISSLAISSSSVRVSVLSQVVMY